MSPRPAVRVRWRHRFDGCEFRRGSRRCTGLQRSFRSARRSRFFRCVLPSRAVHRGLRVPLRHGVRIRTLGPPSPPLGPRSPRSPPVRPRMRAPLSRLKHRHGLSRRFPRSLSAPLAPLRRRDASPSRTSVASFPLCDLGRRSQRTLRASCRRLQRRSRGMISRWRPPRRRKPHRPLPIGQSRSRSSSLSRSVPAAHRMFALRSRDLGNSIRETRSPSRSPVSRGSRTVTTKRRSPPSHGLSGRMRCHDGDRWCLFRPRWAN